MKWPLSTLQVVFRQSLSFGAFEVRQTESKILRLVIFAWQYTWPDLVPRCSILGSDVLMAPAQCPSLGGDQESPRPRGESQPRPASAQSPSDLPRTHSSVLSSPPPQSEGKSWRPWGFKPCWIFYGIIMLYRLTFDAVPKDHVWPSKTHW